MATVFLAQDVRHDRKVALKVLKPELSAIVGAERFLHEIKTTANLQHPHILGLFDSGEAAGQVFYVMPFVEGESLRDRLDRERQLPIEEALRIAREVADALDYAHQHHVVHRDIKPENILLHGGHAQVADFGIALAASQSTGGNRMTETGMSLGTPHYMSPEQAMGDREITGRSDIYALGCVLYEMLTGEPPFNGATAQAVFARVLTEAPRPITLQRHTVPPQVEEAILQALEKLPADRFATAAEFAKALTGGTSGTFSATAHRPRSGTVSIAVRRRQRWATWGMTAVTVVVGAFAVRTTLQLRAAAGRPTTWTYLGFPDSLVPDATAPELALSPDGRSLVLANGTQDGGFFLKRDDALEPVPIPGTTRGLSPSFSRDGEWLLFTADTRLKKVRLTTGTEVTLADSAAGGTNGFGGGTWLDDGTVVFVSQNLNSLRRVDAAGGASTLLLDNSELQGSGFGYPSALPRTRGVLFVSCTSGCATMSLRVLDLKTGKQHLLLNEAGQAWYLPSGHLLYARRDGTLLAAPFDLGTLQLTGAGVPALTNVLVTNGFAQLAWSPSGRIVYATGVGPDNDGGYFRVNRAGVPTPIDPEWKGQLLSLALSPDGRRMAVGVGGGTGVLNIWTKELDRGPFTRLSFGGADRRPTWSPDGKMVAFIRDTLGTSSVFGRYADGSRPDTLLWRYDRQIQEVEWTRSGDWLVARTDNSVAGVGDLVGRRMRGDTTPVVLVASPFTELHPTVSNDGRWLAYTSNESGRNEIYVRPFPNANDGRWQISTAGGIQPRWSPDGGELFYIDANNRMQSVRVTTRPSFNVLSVQPLFDVTRFTLDAFHSSYVVSSDGRSFIFGAPIRSAAGTRPARMVRGDDWFRDLRGRLTP